MADMETRGWMPIETAPRDGAILIRDKRGYIATAEYFLHGWALADSFVETDSFGSPYYLTDEWEPVEWSPLPTPPEDTGHG